MAKFHGRIGFAETSEVAPGVYADVITERNYYGDVVRDSRQLREGEKVNFDLTVGNALSIVADAYASNHFFAMRYVEWAGALWIISVAKVERPRIILSLGGVYNGPTAEVATAP